MNEATIQKYRERLMAMRDQLRNELRTSIEMLPEEVRPVGEHDREPSVGLDRELALEHNEHAIYCQINAALERMDAGTFGKCANCGNKISSARLEALPYTPYCIDCERKIEAGE
jgi:DnaK suppressor protein